MYQNMQSGYDMNYGAAYGADVPPEVFQPIVGDPEILRQMQDSMILNKAQKQPDTQHREMNWDGMLLLGIGGGIAVASLAAWGSWALLASYGVPTVVKIAAASVSGFVGFRFLNPLTWYIRLGRWFRSRGSTWFPNQG